MLPRVVNDLNVVRPLSVKMFEEGLSKLCLLGRFFLSWRHRYNWNGKLPGKQRK
jgi:hypothetical protein